MRIFADSQGCPLFFAVDPAGLLVAFVARELVESSQRPAGLRSRPSVGGASHPSGSKLPRHRSFQ
ncbi:hypothetical protein C4E44_00900 [Pseudomonas sp. MWU12-2312b]|nr:hypothetical protein C4E44_00900 [Pseudomonas sp. MWU12-2312b]